MSRLQDLGIRFDADAEGAGSDFLLSSLEILSSVLSEGGNRFFFDTVDPEQHEFGGVKCQDLFGWIVPIDEVDEFMPKWLEGGDADELEGFDFVGVSWVEGQDGSPEPVFDLN